MTIRVGLTGSIGMGKSTTARFFEEAGCAVWDADAAVHRLYGANGRAVEPIRAVFPDAVRDNAVSREALKEIISAHPPALKRIEAIVHPLVADDRADFVAKNTSDIIVFDIPLLFETGGDAAMDVTVTVSAPTDVQRARVLERGTMSEAQFEQIREKQMPDQEKQERADYIVITDGLDHARSQVNAIITKLRESQNA